MCNIHVEAVYIFREFLGVDSSLIQQIITDIEDDYLEDICNCSSNSITITIAELLTHFLGDYGHLIPQQLLKSWEKTKKKAYQPCDPIINVYNQLEELIEFSNITGTPYT